MSLDSVDFVCQLPNNSISGKRSCVVSGAPAPSASNHSFLFEVEGQAFADEIMSDMTQILEKMRRFALADLDGTSRGFAIGTIGETFTREMPALAGGPFREGMPDAFAALFFGHDYAKGADSSESDDAAVEAFQLAQVFTRCCLHPKYWDVSIGVHYFLRAAAVVAQRAFLCFEPHAPEVFSEVFYDPDHNPSDNV